MKIKRFKEKLLFGLTVFLVSIGLLGAGFFGMQTLADMKTTPAKKNFKEKPLKVVTMEAKVETFVPALKGYGEVKAVQVVTLSSEIGGKIEQIHPRLEVGEFLKKGEELIRIDTKDAELAINSNTKRLAVLKRNYELATLEYNRLKRLRGKNKLVTVSELENAELNRNEILDQIEQLEFAIDNSNLIMDRATLYAPFDARIKTVTVKKGQFVSISEPVVTLADDSVLEIHVSLDSQKAKEFLQFEGKKNQNDRYWFANLKSVPVNVNWTQDGDVKADGYLHRILSFDSRTRTLKVAVRLASNEGETVSKFPVVEGMFCHVEIPGKPINNIVKVPREAVHYRNTAYLAMDSRLKTTSVKVKWSDDDFFYISKGFRPHDLIIISRLSEPVENSLVEASDEKLMIAKRGR